MRRLLLLVTALLGWLFICPASLVLAQVSTPQISFESFDGVYYLSRDAKGLSLLTTEETILAGFPDQANFYGITRQIPKTYQGHSVDVKVLNVTDAAGKSLPYKTSSVSNSIVLTIGDPSINLYGPQTFRINYQTRGVIDLSGQSNQFLLNTTGREWNQPFGRVSATVHIPSSFQASLQGEPSCYTSLNGSGTPCQITTKKSADGTVITSKASNVPAHQALLLKMNFKPATFTQNKGDNKNLVLIIGILIIFAASVPAYLFLRGKK